MGTPEMNLEVQQNLQVTLQRPALKQNKVIIFLGSFTLSKVQFGGMAVLVSSFSFCLFFFASLCSKETLPKELTPLDAISVCIGCSFALPGVV